MKAINFKDIGVDITKINRFKIKNNLYKKILSKDEIAYFFSIDNKIKKKRYLSSIWAIKEAIFKLNIFKQFSFKDISISYDKNGKPFCVNNKKIKLSVSHEKKYTIAVAILVD